MNLEKVVDDKINDLLMKKYKIKKVDIIKK